MNNTDSNTGEIVMYELTNVKLLFITKDYLIILWRLNNRHNRMELKEGLEFYRKCLQDCDRVIADLYHQDIPRERKQALIDKLLITRNKLVKTIERIEELLR